MNLRSPLIVRLLALALIASGATGVVGQNRQRNKDETALDRLLRRNDDPRPGRTVSDANVQLGSRGGVSDWEFPQSADRWLNSPPLTAESLAGKGVVMVFFEEECPACAAKWPDLTKLATEYADRPVLFLAINSGNDARTVSKYAGQQRINWPLIADLDRSFENAMGLSQVSMDNVIQVRYVTADGVAHLGKWSDLAGTAEAALEGAAWKVEPPAPRKLQRAWYSVELGSYAEAARDVRRYADESRDTPEKRFATKLLKAVKDAMAGDFATAGDAYKEQRFWEAYKALTSFEQRYDGYELPGSVAPAIKKLAERDDVKNQLKARKSLDKAMRTASRGGDAALRRGLGMLERIVSGSPGTEAASEAQKILAQYNR